MDALKEARCDLIFTDQGISGVAIEREGLSQALDAIQEGGTLVVWKLDRLGRSLGFLADLIAQSDKVAAKDSLGAEKPKLSKGQGGEYSVIFKLPKVSPHKAFPSLRIELMAVIDELEKSVKASTKTKDEEVEVSEMENA